MDNFNETFNKYYQDRQDFLKLSPKEKAKKSSWEHFKLFHYMVFGDNPKEEMKEEILKKAEDWYKLNPKWTIPSMKYWWDYLEIPKQTSVDNLAFRVLCSAEEGELKDIYDEEKFINKQNDLEEKETKVVSKLNQDLPVIEMDVDSKEITADDLPF